MFAYVRYAQDGQRAILPVSLMKEFSPETPGDFDKLSRVQAYWRGEDGEDEGYYPAFVNEMAETLDSLHMTLKRGRSPLPRIILSKSHQPSKNPSVASKDARQLKRKRKAEAQHAQLSSILSTFNRNGKAAVESAPSTAMSSCEKNVVGDGELDLKELLRAKEEELKIVKAKLRKSEATCKRLQLGLVEKIEIARDRALKKPCCQTPLEGAVVAEFISLPSTSTAGLSQGVLQELVALPSNAGSLPYQPATPAVVESLAASRGALPSPDSLPVEMQQEPPHPSSAAMLPSSPGCSSNDGGMCSSILQFSTKLCAGHWLYGST
ncbi:BEN domain-containing protein 5-like [Ixodes scapularis]|uniref:BEN domain-containing protein 5-like n=1 Tax=Ixodes scapularis TaxID=6945 RepID=UPI001A9CC15D|nr:BEN domain-containing protein 5-like [Ixodes scapularis]